jgi:Fe-S cluster assembly scaffold protein SufB
MSAEPIVNQEYKYGFSQPENYIFKSRKGLDYEIVEQISQMKGEPQWLLDFRKRSLGYFLKRPMPNWGGNLGDIDFQDIYYYVKPVNQAGKSWDDVPAEIKDTFDKLGIPEAERKYLAGAGSQYESEVVYHKVRKDLEDQGVIFVDPDTGFREHEEIFRPYFATVIPPNDNKFAALNSAVFSGGSFIYIPKGVHVDLPLQAYFRINAQNMGQFERTLIIADEDSYVHYVEGCFLAGARIRTRDGEKLIEEIREGDEVLTHKGRYRRVYHTMDRPYNGTIYNVRFYGDSWRELHITEEHPLLVVRGKNAQSNDFTPAWVYASDVRTDDLLVAPASLADVYGKSPVHRDQSFLYLPIRDIDAEQMDTTVYNFSVEEDESYIGEGVISHNCTAPTYTTDSLHSAVVEIIVKRGARVRYTTIQNWSKNVYNLVTKRAQAFANATMEWVDGNLGCLAEGSTVTTPEGVKPIEQLEVGDKVLSYDAGKGELCFQSVKAKRFSGMQPVHTISIGERKLQVTANHPFYSYRYDPDAPRKLGRYQLGYVRADQLKEAIIPRTSIDYGNPYQLRVPNLVTEFASLNQYASDLTMTRSRATRMTQAEYTTDNLMWLFGYWVGDGNIEVKVGQTEGVIRYAKVGFSTPTTDRARERLLQTMTAIADRPPTERADGHHLAWSSKELAEFFHINGFKGNARTKRVPAWVWSLPESQRLAFIAGYLDADGSISRGRFNLKSANRELLEDIASLLVTLGVTSRLFTEFAEPRQVEIMGVIATAHSAYRLNFAADARFYSHVSAVLRAQAEQEAPTVQQNRQVGRSSIELPSNVEIVDVDVSEPSAEAVPTWDIEVEGTGNFISQGYIVHNSKLTMKYPAVWLMEPGARGEVLSVAFASDGQHQDAGGKMVHVAPHTSSTIVSKSISKGTGRSSYRGLLKVQKGAPHVKSNVRCDALLLDETSRTDTYPYIEIEEEDVEVGHEASVSKVGEEQLFYLMSRGLSESEAYTMIVNGFIEPIAKELPLEYAVELNRLIQLEMSGSVG